MNALACSRYSQGSMSPAQCTSSSRWKLFCNSVIDLRAVHPQGPVVVEHQPVKAKDAAHGGGTPFCHLRVCLRGNLYPARDFEERRPPPLPRELEGVEP